MIEFPEVKSRIQKIQNFDGIELSILREDEIHPQISGNKYRKIKYNLEAYSEGNYTSLLTFGGAYSNHISAVAAAGQEFGIPTIGIIRGEELASKINENPTLLFAKSCGMQFKFISRSDYRKKSTPEFIQHLKEELGAIYILPEGGTNELAVKGCMEILNEQTQNFDFICTAVGTGGTISGITKAAEKHQKILGFPALKDADFLKNEIEKFSNSTDFSLIQNYHFGGYGKCTEELIEFINNFKKEYDVPLDPVYTGKMMYGIMDLIQNNYFTKGSKILAIHTGGLQGIKGMNQLLIKKNKQIIL